MRSFREWSLGHVLAASALWVLWLLAFAILLPLALLAAHRPAAPPGAVVLPPQLSDFRVHLVGAPGWRSAVWAPVALICLGPPALLALAWLRARRRHGGSAD